MTYLPHLLLTPPSYSYDIHINELTVYYYYPPRRGCMAFFRFNDVKRCFRIFFFLFILKDARVSETKSFSYFFFFIRFFYDRKSFSPHKLFFFHAKLARDRRRAAPQQVPRRAVNDISSDV